MNNQEARTVLASVLTPYRDHSYVQLCVMIGQPKRVLRATGPSGVEYQIDIDAYWDSRSGGDVRVFGCIDDMGWRAFLPLTDSFIKAPDGSFVGEER